LINLSTNKKVFQRLSSKCVQLIFLFYKTFSQDDLKNDLKQKFTEQLSAALEILKNIYFNNNSHHYNFVQFVYIQYLNYLINNANTNSIKDYLENIVKENINEKLIVEIICILLSNNKLDIFKLIPELKNKLFSVLSECQDVKLKIKLLLHIDQCLRQTNGQTLYIYLRSYPKLCTICVKLLNTNIINDSLGKLCIAFELQSILLENNRPS
jgi:sulfur relay (sulfurtransferase) DsrC/TusE family protein